MPTEFRVSQATCFTTRPRRTLMLAPYDLHSISAPASADSSRRSDTGETTWAGSESRYDSRSIMVSGPEAALARFAGAVG